MLTTILVILGAVIIGGVLVTFIIRSITRPLSALVTTANKIADGDLTEQIEVNSKDEIGKLSSSFNVD